MENSSNDYHISFFKPTTPQAKANRNIVLWLVSIWFVAIFGFQFLLRIIEKPTPEPAYTAFVNVWQNVHDGAFNETELQELGKISLSVLGKIAIDPQDKVTLNNALSWSLYTLLPDSMQTDLLQKVQAFEKLKSEIAEISDPVYLDSKKALSAEYSPVLNLDEMDIRSQLLPLELNSEQMQVLSEKTRNDLPAIMGKYFIHNQSFLTDSKFLGFPFHYFYTAVFLLVLFVGLCWLYCVRIDKLNAKMNIVD